MALPRVEFEDVEAVIPRVVAPGGRLTGLGDFVGRRVQVVVLPEAREPKRRTERG